MFYVSMLHVSMFSVFPRARFFKLNCTCWSLYKSVNYLVQERLQELVEMQRTVQKLRERSKHEQTGESPLFSAVFIVSGPSFLSVDSLRARMTSNSRWSAGIHFGRAKSSTPCMDFLVQLSTVFCWNVWSCMCWNKLFCERRWSTARVILHSCIFPGHLDGTGVDFLWCSSGKTASWRSSARWRNFWRKRNRFCERSIFLSAHCQIYNLFGNQIC